MYSIFVRDSLTGLTEDISTASQLELTPTAPREAFECGVRDEHVSLVRDRVYSVNDDILRGSARNLVVTHLSLLVHMTFSVPALEHLSVKMVEHPLDFANALAAVRMDLV